MDNLIAALDDLQGSSIDKANALLIRLNDVETDDPEAAQRLALMKMVVPSVVGFLPTDPAELDTLLLAGAQLFLKARSDDAPLVELFAPDGAQHRSGAPSCDSCGVPWDEPNPDCEFAHRVPA